MKQDVNMQNDGGGGDNNLFKSTLNGSAAYSNPALSISNDSENQALGAFKGSNDFMLVEDYKKKSSTKESLRKVWPWMRTKARNACTRKMLFKRLPILTWLPKYSPSYFAGDLVAGVTVGLTVIPQSLAYSSIAGLPAEYGLYGSFLCCFVYIIFGSCKDVPVGPTAISSLMTFQAISEVAPEYRPPYAILLCFLVGIVELLMGLLGLGFLIDFVSGPVSSGFTSAVALIIVTSQVKDILAITTTGTTFIDMWISIFSEIHNTQAWDTVLGICCIAVILIMRLIGMIKLGEEEAEDDEKFQKGPSTWQKVVNKFLWLVGTSRNAILVVVTGAMGYAFTVSGKPPFMLIGDIPPGLPNFQPPPFSVTRVNGTDTFFDMISQFSSALIVIPLISLLETIAICKAFANGKPVDATQELIAIGVSNIANSFVQSYPGTGSLSRGAVNNASGVHTPLGSIYTGLLVIVALLFFTPYFYYIPKSSLAAIIIAAVIFMVEVKVVKPMWRTKKSDLIPGLGTFIACLLLPLEIGILIGIGLNLLFILYHAARPKITIENLTSAGGVEYLMLTPDRCLIFPSVDYVRNLVTKHSLKKSLPVVIDCSHVYGADFSAAVVIETLTKDFSSRSQPLFFYNLKPSVCAVFEGLSPKEFNVFYNEEQFNELIKNKTPMKPKNFDDV